MKDFEEIYNGLYSEFNDKAEHMNDELKEIKNYSIKKLVKPIIIIIIFFTILILITKKFELLFLLLFIPGPLLIYYFMAKGSKVRTTYTPNMDIMNQIYNKIINDSFDGLTYCNQTKGIDKSTYDNGLFGEYDKYYSEAELKGVLNNSNKLEMSYVATSKEYMDGSKRPFKDIHYTFRGYLLLIELNKKTNMQIRINDKKIELLNKQDSSTKDDYLINNIQNILKEFKQKNNIATDCTLTNDKMYVRVATNALGIHGLDYILDKEILKKYYDEINEMINLANELLKILQ